MISIASRRAPALAAALWICAVPVGYHAIARPDADVCADPASVSVAGFAPVATAAAKARVIGSDDGSPSYRGRLVTSQPWVHSPLWTVARTHDLAKSYFAPSVMLSRVSADARFSVAMREVDGVRLPIHLRVVESGSYVNSVAYLYVFGDRPIRWPFLASVRHAIPQLIGGRLPLTMIVAEGDSESEHAGANEAILVDWVQSAWTRFAEVCRP